MIGPEPQKALYAAIVACGAVGARVYDRVPPDAVFPYVTIGDEQVIDNGTSCSDGFTAYFDVHVWSRPDATSKVEVKTIAQAVRTAVLGVAVIAGFEIICIEAESARTLRDPDGLTEHAILTFRFELDPA